MSDAAYVIGGWVLAAVVLAWYTGWLYLRTRRASRSGEPR